MLITSYIAVGNVQSMTTSKTAIHNLKNLFFTVITTTACTHQPEYGCRETASRMKMAAENTTAPRGVAEVALARATIAEIRHVFMTHFI